MPSENLSAAPVIAIADVPVVRDRRRRGQQVELVGTIRGFDVTEGTVTIVDVQDGRRVHHELTVRLTAQATITVDGKRRVLSSLPFGQKLIVTGVLDGTVVTSGEVHALTLTGLFAV
ncbi:hypothetical protein [Cryptosporangium aurantiacum]|uniref:DUF5666 domain-containing protein n=1 Tax=Cryptosporangium aurantiacum TaxID=134849 RepID=A0A1M7RPC8_9ACTN|nr:hypothetical protein [Cryptosporangium aurantiacum]SHN48020.1 hypothetical protein SAMN05443668_13219 [Cryptosporangium aurantiacum]